MNVVSRLIIFSNTEDPTHGSRDGRCVAANCFVLYDVYCTPLFRTAPNAWQQRRLVRGCMLPTACSACYVLLECSRGGMHTIPYARRITHGTKEVHELPSVDFLVSALHVSTCQPLGLQI